MKRSVMCIAIVTIVGFSGSTHARYVTSDPSGLEGGLNSYQYSAQNPLRFVDPDGLRPCPPGMVPPGIPCWINDGDGKGSGYPNEGRCATAECVAGISPLPEYGCSTECNFTYQPVCTGAAAGAAVLGGSGVLVMGGCIVAKVFVCSEICENDQQQCTY